MPAGFLRRFTTDPGIAVLTAIEGVVIIDREPPGQVVGVGTGTALVVGEFEDGPFGTGANAVGALWPAGPTEVFSGTDLVEMFGGFGHTYDGVVSNNPSARVRRADSAIIDEYWNGNGFIALVNKRYRRLIIQRVDTSVGSVEFSRLASISGNPGFTYDLEPAQIVVFDIGAGNKTATFSAATATISSGVGAYPTTFVGGESITLASEGTTTQVFFTAADQTQAQVIARVNAALGYTAWVDAGGGVTRFDGRVRGTSSSIQVVSGTALVFTKTGFVAGAAVAGTGNVANIDAVTIAEAHTIINAVSTSVTVDRDANGKIRITNTGTPLTGTIQVDSTTTADAFGWAEEVTATAATGVDGFIPAGTRIRNAGGTEWVTMQTIAVTAANAGPYTVKVRHALDNAAGLAALASTVNVVPFAIPLGAFSVLNVLPLTAALTEAQLDAAYSTAIDATISLTNVSKEANIIWSARQSNAIRTKLRQNALDASAGGARGRMTVVSPPLKATRATAKLTGAQPGVGAYRHERLVYAFPGVTTTVPQIAARGTAGGLGFTVDGVIDTHFDSWVVSVMSQINPEENPGQETDFLSLIIAVERSNSDVQNMTIDDYISFRASGIAALRIDAGVAFIQSGVTSVDPTTQQAKRNIARRRMADFIQDSLGEAMTKYSKKPMTKVRRADVLSDHDDFLSGLLSANDPANQRIESYLIDGKSGNTPESMAVGIFRVKSKVRTLPSMDVIVLDTEIGENVVTVSEAA